MMSKNAEELASPTGYDMRPNSAALGLEATSKQRDAMRLEDGRLDVRPAKGRRVRYAYFLTGAATASLMVLLIWVFLSVPLCIIGTILGRNWSGGSVAIPVAAPVSVAAARSQLRSLATRATKDA